MRSWTRIMPLLFALTMLCVGRATAQSDTDATKTDAAHHKVEFENDQVRVVRWMIPPGDKTAQHSHPAMVNIYLTDVEAKATTPDGKVTPVHGKAGAAAWKTPGTHIVENVGTAPMSGILVEPKKPHSALPAGAQDVITADPKHDKVEFENDQIRVIRYHFEPGEKSPMHGHPDNVQVMLTDSNAKVTTPDGKTISNPGKAGEVRWRPAGQHAIEDTGKAYEGILVEMKGGK